MARVNVAREYCVLTVIMTGKRSATPLGTLQKKEDSETHVPSSEAEPPTEDRGDGSAPAVRSREISVRMVPPVTGAFALIETETIGESKERDIVREPAENIPFVAAADLLLLVPPPNLHLSAELEVHRDAKAAVPPNRAFALDAALSARSRARPRRVTVELPVVGTFDTQEELREGRSMVKGSDTVVTDTCRLEMVIRASKDWKRGTLEDERREGTDV